MVRSAGTCCALAQVSECSTSWASMWTWLRRQIPYARVSVFYLGLVFAQELPHASRLPSYGEAQSSWANKPPAPFLRAAAWTNRTVSASSSEPARRCQCA
uniref:Putative secreted protein n=1 Tax=Anopheles triannulatus TaxID=58253 RepID=A0A2M4B1Y2_9DIPT